VQKKSRFPRSVVAPEATAAATIKASQKERSDFFDGPGSLDERGVVDDRLPLQERSDVQK
jgi:hypothetical protein